jgi:ABC-type glycerol-3-phosphate transport system permease component
MVTRVAGKKVVSGAHSIRDAKGDRLLRVFCYIVSFVWCGFTIFPIFWMFTSTFKDAVDVMRMPPVFFPSVPAAYTIQLDYADMADVPSSELDEIIREDLALAVWRVIDMMPRIHMGRLHVEAYMGDRKVAGAYLPKYTYTYYRATWPTQRLTDALVLREVERGRAHFATNLEIDLDGSLRPFRTGNPDTESAGKIADLFLGEQIGTRGRLVSVYERVHLGSLINSYVDAWRAPGRRYPGLSMFNFFTNGLIITGSLILCHMFISGGAGYALSRLLSPRLSRFMTIFFLATMMVPMATTLVPLYELVGKMGLLDTYWGVVLPGIPGAFAIYLYKGFFDALPQDILDASRIDGASEYRIFAQILAPMSRNVFTVIALLTFLWAWNDFFWPLLVLRSTPRWTFTLAIYFSINSIKQAEGVASGMALATMASLPTLLVFTIFSKSIQQGLIWSGLKG